MGDRNSLSVIIPCFNEAGSIKTTIEKLYNVLHKEGINFSIVVVNDGSTDNSLQEIKKAKVPFTLINLPLNRGYGYAIKRGVKRTESEWVGIIDADLTYAPEDIVSLWKVKEGCDMVVGARVGKNIHIPFFRRPMKWILRKFAEWIAGCGIPDLNSGVRIFRRDKALEFYRLYPDGFSFTTTITMCFLSSDYEVLFVPVSYYAKRKGRSKIRPIKDTYNFVVLLMQLAVYYNPLKVFLPVSFFLFFLSVLSFMYDIVIAKNIGDKSIVVILFAAMTFFLGLIADLIVKRIHI